MTDENAKRKYRHLKNIIDGKYSTERYDAKDIGEEINLNTISNDLMISDAERNLIQLIKARPNIDFDGSKAIAIAKAKKEAEDKAKKEAEDKRKKEAEDKRKK